MTTSPERIDISLNRDDGEESDFCRCLERIDLLFQQDYLQRVGEVPASLQHYFLSEDDISLRLSFPQGTPCWADASDARLPDTNELLTRRLQFLTEVFDLTAVERDILLAGLLPRLSEHYAALPDSGLGEGVSRPLLTRLFSASRTEYQLLQSALHTVSPLFQFALLAEEKSRTNRKMPPTYILHEAVWHFFCGNAASRSPWTRRVGPDSLAWYPVSLGEKIHPLCLRPDTEKLPVVVLEGHEQDGRERVLATILADYHRALRSVDIDVLTSLPETQQEQMTGEIVRDALLDNAALVLEYGSGAVIEKSRILSTLERLLPQVRLPVFILPDSTAEVASFSGLAMVHLAMPLPTAEEKVELLKMSWPDADDTEALLTLTQRYAFSPADVPLLLEEADYYRQIRDENAPLSIDDLRQTLSRRSRKNFGKLAQRITPVRTFDDIVLSDALKKQMGEILAAIRLRESVTVKHFAHKTAGKNGISALFYGDSGTGKTLAAEVLAQHLEVDLIKVDLSSVVNKYVGETEKNLARIFDLAQADSGVLFFDEADALFGKRSETKDAHDRHANIEVSYLLQRLENYPGLVILATNNRSHLDSAFNRRFTFITRFTYPDVNLRAQMWQSVWPMTLALADDVDFSSLAARSELTGANIRNVALLAAVLAAEGGSDVIHLSHIEQAVSRELGKLGRLPL